MNRVQLGLIWACLFKQVGHKGVRLVLVETNKRTSCEVGFPSITPGRSPVLAAHRSKFVVTRFPPARRAQFPSVP